MEFDPKLWEYATPRERELLEAWKENGSVSQAAVILNVSPSTVKDAHFRVKRRAARRGYAPEHDLTHPIAPGMVSKGTSIRYDGAGNIQQYWNKTKQEGRDPIEAVSLPDPKTIVKLSTLYDPEGRVAQQWIAEKPDAKAQAEAWKAYAEELARDLPRVEPASGPEHVASELMAAYPVGDHHMGMLVWKHETGESYDLNIGEELLKGATEYLLNAAPACDTALIVFLGDFMHYDSFVPVTPMNRNPLDADGRFPKMVRASVRAMRYMIQRSLYRHGRVHVIIEIGNHDLSSSIFLMECLSNIYENEPRVTIDTSPKHYHYFRFGQVLIGTHHGYDAKLQNLPLIMATDRAEDWGATKHRYIWTGHVHHAQKLSQKDFPGVEVESFRILPSNDAWHTQKGYRAKRDMKAIVLHRKFGEVARHTVNPEMLRRT